VCIRWDWSFVFVVVAAVCSGSNADPWAGNTNTWSFSGHPQIHQHQRMSARACVYLLYRPDNSNICFWLDVLIPGIFTTGGKNNFINTSEARETSCLISEVGSTSPLRHLEGLGNAVSSPSWVRGKAPPANTFLWILSSKITSGGDRFGCVHAIFSGFDWQGPGLIKPIECPFTTGLELWHWLSGVNYFSG